MYMYMTCIVIQDKQELSVSNHGVFGLQQLKQTNETVFRLGGAAAPPLRTNILHRVELLHCAAQNILRASQQTLQNIIALQHRSGYMNREYFKRQNTCTTRSAMTLDFAHLLPMRLATGSKREKLFRNREAI